MYHLKMLNSSAENKQRFSSTSIKGFEPFTPMSLRNVSSQTTQQHDDVLIIYFHCANSPGDFSTQYTA